MMTKSNIGVIARYFYITPKQLTEGPYTGHARKARKVHIWWLRTNHQLPYDLISKITGAAISSCQRSYNEIEQAIDRGDKMYLNITNQLKAQ